MSQQPLPPADCLAGANLRARDGSEVSVERLVADGGPTFVYAIRRPGCVLCRDEAQKLWAARAQLEAAGLRVVCVVHEWIEREVEAFLREPGGFWGGPCFHDADKALYKLFGGGEVRTASVWSLLNPWHPMWGRVAAARHNVHESNLSGEATILGGLLVLVPAPRGARVVWMRAEHSFGDFPETREVIEAATRALQEPDTGRAA